MSFAPNASVIDKGHKTSFLTVLMLALVTLFTVGCGDSNDEFIYTGNNNPANTGSLTFQFQQPATAQAVNVPAGTTSLEFDFFNAADVLVFEATAPYADTVTVANVPAGVTDVVITAYGPGDVPLATITNGVTVAVGGNTNVNLTGVTPTPVTLVSVTSVPASVSLNVSATQQLAFSGTFSNGETVPFNATTGGTAVYSGFDAAVVSVSTTGLVTGLSQGTTSIDAAFTLNGATVNVTDIPVTVGGGAALGQLIVEPDSLTFNNGGLLGALTSIGSENFNSLATFRAYYQAPGSTTRVEVTPQVGVTFGSFFPSTVTANSFTYLQLGGEGIALASNPLAPTLPYGATAVMTVTYINDGNVYTDTVDITIGNPELIGFEANDLNLPLNAQFPVLVQARFSNGLVIPVDFLEEMTGDSYSLAAATNTAGVSTAPGDFLIEVTDGTAGATVVINILRNEQTTPVGSFDVTLIDGIVEDVVLAPGETVADPIASYTVTLVYDDEAGTTQDVTLFWQALDVDDEEGTGAVAPGGFLGGEFSLGGRLLGVRTGEVTLSLVDINGFLNEGLGLPGSDDPDADNNDLVITVLSVVTGFPGFPN